MVGKRKHQPHATGQIPRHTADAVPVTHYTRGPLVVMLGAAQSLILTLYNIICVTRQIQNTRQSVNLDKIKINNSCTQIATDFKKLCAFTNICNSETGTTTLTRTV